MTFEISNVQKSSLSPLPQSLCLSHYSSWKWSTLLMQTWTKSIYPKKITITIFCQNLPTFFCLHLLTMFFQSFQQNLLKFEMHFLIILKSRCSQGFLGDTSRIASTKMPSNPQLNPHVAAALGSVLIWGGEISSPRAMGQRQQEIVWGRGRGWAHPRYC